MPVNRDNGRPAAVARSNADTKYYDKRTSTLMACVWPLTERLNGWLAEWLLTFICSYTNAVCARRWLCSISHKCTTVCVCVCVCACVFNATYTKWKSPIQFGLVYTELRWFCSIIGFICFSTFVSIIHSFIRVIVLFLVKLEIKSRILSE